MSIILKQPMIHNTFFEIIIDFILNTHRGSLKWVAMCPSAYHWHTLPRPLYVSAHWVSTAERSTEETLFIHLSLSIFWTP